jgi:hypothetical protein
MKSPVIKRSIIIDGHKTSVSLEDAFWSGLKEIAQAQGDRQDAPRGQPVLRDPPVRTRPGPQWDKWVNCSGRTLGLFKFKIADKYDCLAARATQWMNNSAVS